MKKIIIFKLMISMFLLTFIGESIAQEKIAKSIEEYNSLIKNANPGDVIVLKI